MISFQLNPKTGCEIYRDGALVEIVPVKGHVERLEALGWKPAKTPRYGWSQTGKEITRRGAR